MSTDQNYKIVQGDTFSLEATYENNSGSAINLTGYTSYFEVRDQPGGFILCATASLGIIPASGSFSGDGISIVSASTGTITLDISPAKTLEFNYPRSSFQWRVKSPSGKNTTLVKGWFLVDAGTIPNA